MSVYYLFQELNDEILWANPTNDYSAIGSRMEPRTAPWSLGYASTIGGNVGPYQELVDMFFTKDGLTIEAVSYTHLDVYKRQTKKKYFHLTDSKKT